MYIYHDIDVFVIMRTSSGGVSLHHFENQKTSAPRSNPGLMWSCDLSRKRTWFSKFVELFAFFRICLERHEKSFRSSVLGGSSHLYSKWLITMVIISPLSIRVVPRVGSRKKNDPWKLQFIVGILASKLSQTLTNVDPPEKSLPKLHSSKSHFLKCHECMLPSWLT